MKYSLLKGTDSIDVFVDRSEILVLCIIHQGGIFLQTVL